MSIALQLRFFASVREAMGVTTMPLQLDCAPADLAELLQLLDPAHTRAALWDSRLRIAVNGALIAPGAALQLHSGDELALLPPVTGG